MHTSFYSVVKDCRKVRASSCVLGRRLFRSALAGTGPGDDVSCRCSFVDPGIGAGDLKIKSMRAGYIGMVEGICPTDACLLLMFECCCSLF